MNKHQQIEVLRILKQNSDVVLNENSNGVFVNGQRVNGAAVLPQNCLIRIVPYSFKLQKIDLFLISRIHQNTC